MWMRLCPVCRVGAEEAQVERLRALSMRLGVVEQRGKETWRSWYVLRGRRGVRGSSCFNGVYSWQLPCILCSRNQGWFQSSLMDRRDKTPSLDARSCMYYP